MTGFANGFGAVVARAEQGWISRRQAARDLAIGCVTLKTLLDPRLWLFYESAHCTLALFDLTTLDDWKDHDDILAAVLT